MSTSAEPQPPSAATSETVPDSVEPRRSFLVKMIAGVIGFVIVAVPVFLGTVFFLDPLWKRKRGEFGFVKVTTLDSLPENGAPVKFTIRADIDNIWTRKKNEPVGSVYVRRLPDDTKGEPQLAAFNVTCPHLGCAIDYTTKDEKPDAEAEALGGDSADEADGDTPGKFWCPCHASSFALDGERLNDIPPRPMDSLPVKLEGNDVLVQFQNFEIGKEEKVAS